MKRKLLSVAGGVGIPFMLRVIWLQLAKYPSLDGLSQIISSLVFWPRWVADSIFPPRCESCITNEAIAALMIGNFLTYSLLTYAVLWWRAKRRRIAKSRVVVA